MMGRMAVENLSVRRRDTLLFGDVSFQIDPGEIVGLTGPSGAGKSTLADCLLGINPPDVSISSGRVDAGAVRVGLVQQYTRSAFNPALPIGFQLTEGAGYVSRATLLATLERLRLADPERLLAAGPEEISGGEAQRLQLAMVLLRGADVLVLDEPTASLDRANEHALMDLLRELARRDGLGILLISHKQDLLRAWADRSLLLEGGRLLACSAAGGPMPTPSRTGRLGPEVLSVRNLRMDLPGLGRLMEDIALTIRAGETVCLTGPSGAGKTTLARAIAGFVPPVAGDIRLCGRDMSNSGVSGRGAGEVALLFQEPRESLNPVWGIGFQLRRTLKCRDLGVDLESALAEVGLMPKLARHRIGELSGGEQQRVALAMVLASNPKLVIADEALSALDRANQQAMLSLLSNAQERLGFAMLFISHDFAQTGFWSGATFELSGGRLKEI